MAQMNVAQRQRVPVSRALSMAKADTHKQSPLGAPRKKAPKASGRPSRQGQRGVMSLNARGC